MTNSASVYPPLLGWLLQWGAAAEVLEPAALRERLAAAKRARTMRLTEREKNPHRLIVRLERTIPQRVGVTATVAVPAYAGVPVTHRVLATSFTVVTGHSRQEIDMETNWEALAEVGGTVVVLMGVAHRAVIARRLLAGGLARVSSRVGSVEVQVEVTDEVMPGVVSIPHGWGHGRTGAELGVAARHAGANSNVLTPSDAVDPLVFRLSIFVLAIFVGYYVVWSVTTALHTARMAVTNAMSSVIVGGALLAVGVALVADDAGPIWASGFGFVALGFASVNIFGGFLVTQRMLGMFQRKKKS